MHAGHPATTHSEAVRAESIGAYVTSGNQLPNSSDQWVASCVLRIRSGLRSARRGDHPEALTPAELAGRSRPHRWPRSGLLHPGGPRREIRRRCHLIVTSTRTSTRKIVELRGFEPLTFCMPYRPGLSPDGAERRPACRLPAATEAGCGLARPGAWRRWLPTWLPVNPLAVPMFG
jgi:hypothetical protein